MLAGWLSLFLTFALFMKLSLMIGCVHSIDIGCKGSIYGLDIFRKHPRLVFVFSMEINYQTLLLYLHVFSVLVRLTWFCKKIKLWTKVRSFKFQKNELIPTLFAHARECIFHFQKIFSWPQPCWGLGLPLNHGKFIH